MSTFIEERLLECVGYGTMGGPTHSTRKVTLNSGIKRRNQRWAYPHYRFHVLYKNLMPEHHAEVIAAFNACGGGVRSFRLKDWMDFQVEDQLLPVLGTGSPQQIQLIKSYTFGSQTASRLIRKPVEGTVVVTANGTPVSQESSPTELEVDHTTGIITITAPPASVLRWSGEFDVPVMFEDDELPFSGDDKGQNGLFLNGDVALEEDISV